jgi:heat shock protein HslJ/uncharacterized membrane protein
MKHKINTLIIAAVLLLTACTKSETQVKDESGKEFGGRFQIEKEKFEQGIDFTARGNEPFWSLDIDFENVIRFKSLTEISEFNSAKFEEEMIDRVGGIRYRAQSDEGVLVITIIEEECYDTMSGEKFSHSVDVEIKRAIDDEFFKFKGCGNFLSDYRLNDIWLMKEMTGVELVKDQLQKGLPVFEFHLKENRFVGHAGCNNLSGKIGVKGNAITFGNIAGTKMLCPNMNVENAVLEALSNKSFKYEIENMYLTLTNDGGMKMIFRKID